MPRRRRRAAAVESIDEERNLAMRILLHSPKDLFAGVLAFAAVSAIVANAMFLQAGRHPYPMFGTASVSQMPTVTSTPVPAPLPRVRPPEAEARVIEKPVEAPVASKPGATPLRPPAAIAAKSDPVGDLIVSTRRIAAVQRALTEYGYGQLKTTGVIGTDTQAAIQKFERDRKLPVTGQLSDRLIHDLSVLTGRPIE